MKNNELIETPGYFWLPDSPDEKIPGLLRISKFGETSVDLVGIFGDYESEINKIMNLKHQGIHRVCGIVRKGGSVTLTQCNYLSVSTTLGGGLDEVIISAQTAYVGANFKQSEITFKEYDFWVEGLSEWLAMSGITTTTDITTASGTIEYHQPEPITHNLPDGITMIFDFASSGPPPLSIYPSTEVRVAQTPYISLSSTESKTLDYFNSLAIKLNRFLSLVVDQEVQIQTIKVTAEQKVDGGNETHKFLVRVYRRFSPSNDREAKIDRHMILFSYPTINNFDEMINKWLENYENDTFANAIDLYFASKSNVPLRSQTRFLYLCQSIEILHRRMFPNEMIIPEQEFNDLKRKIMTSLPTNCPEFVQRKIESANQLSLRDRVKRMMNLFEDWFRGDEDGEEFAKRVSNTRNYLTHYHGRRNSRAADEQELWNLYNKLEILTTLYVLMLLGLDKNDIIPIVQETSSRLNQELRINSTD